jgi:hypothetical protein
MKSLLLLVVVFVLSCGYDYKNSFSKEDKELRDTLEVVQMNWNVSTNCQNVNRGNPSFQIYDIDSKQSFGPYYLSSSTSRESYVINCISENWLCYGAWLGQGSYYDHNLKQFIDYNETYFSWGCGKDCKEPILPLTCHQCVGGGVKNVYLNCGN